MHHGDYHPFTGLEILVNSYKSSLPSEVKKQIRTMIEREVEALTIYQKEGIEEYINFLRSRTQQKPKFEVKK